MISWGVAYVVTAEEMLWSQVMLWPSWDSQMLLLVYIIGSQLVGLFFFCWCNRKAMQNNMQKANANNNMHLTIWSCIKYLSKLERSMKSECQGGATDTISKDCTLNTLVFQLFLTQKKKKHLQHQSCWVTIWYNLPKM